MAASVLLNFANGIDFTPTDPLIGLVRTGARLLSYDQLSVATFSKNDSERKEQIRRKIAELRNMLEDRCLSTEDKGERIRLLVLLDFNTWHFLNSSGLSPFDAAFPSLKVEYIKTVVEEVFGKKNPLLSRFDYIFILTDDFSDIERSKHYQLVAYHGYYRIGVSDQWFSKEQIQLNKYRDETVKSLGNPDAALLLTDNKVQTAYHKFLEKQQEAICLIKHYLAMIGKETAFDEGCKNLFDVKTISDFEKTDYDHKLLTLVRNVAGIGADCFRDCTYFIMSLRQSVASHQCKDSIVLKSLIQLLCTTDDEQYKNLFRPIDSSDFHKLLIMEEPDDKHINKEILLQYSQDIHQMGTQLGGTEWASLEGKLTGMSWESDKDVEYYVYHPCEADAEGAYKTENEATYAEGNDKVRLFKDKRRVPLFFGATTADWQWYREVMASLKDCLTFEDENDRPNVEDQGRTSDSELPKERKTTKYGILGTLIEKMSTPTIESTVNYDQYIANRKKDIDQLAKNADILKKKLVKLGIRSRFIWIATVACLAFTMCFAFHFFYSGDKSYTLLIPSELVAFVATILIAMGIAQWIVKEKILDVYREIDKLFDHLQTLAKTHLKSVNDLVTEMNKADADRKTLSEMKTIYSEWTTHNKKVEVWVNYIRALNLLINDVLRYLGAKNEKGEKSKLNINSSILDSKPAVVPQIWSKDIYRNMEPKVIIVNQNKENTISNATSFISNYVFTIVQK